MFTETKSGNAKIKTNDMNNDDRNDATNQPVSLNNEDTPDAAIFVRATPAPSANTASGGSLLQSDNGNVYFEEYDYFNREKDNYTYLYEVESS